MISLYAFNSLLLPWGSVMFRKNILNTCIQVVMESLNCVYLYVLIAPINQHVTLSVPCEWIMIITFKVKPF
jgi:hypothetical protein